MKNTAGKTCRRQCFQVVFPIIPGGASCLAGVLAFGPVKGFIYNYIGLSVGSVIAYFLSRKYGLKIILKFFDKSLVDKYLKYIRNKTFKKIFNPFYMIYHEEVGGRTILNEKTNETEINPNFEINAIIHT